MSSSNKNFGRNICLAAGLFFAFLLISPIKFGPVTPQTAIPKTPVTETAASSAATAAHQATATITATPDNTTGPDDISSAAEYLDIPLTIGDISYRFSVNTNKENVLELAEKVCSENAGALGIAATDLEARCIAPVAKSLSEQVDLTLEQIVPIDLDVDGRSVKFEIDTAVATSVQDQATLFCTTYGAEFGVTQETLGECTQNVVRALQAKLAARVPASQQPGEQKQKAAPDMIQIDLDIQGRVVRFNVEATYASIEAQATNFCSTHGAEFGVTQESLDECRLNIQRALEEKVLAHVEQQQQQQQQQQQAATQELQAQGNRTFQTDLDIQGRVVRFNVEATYASIEAQATNFCSTHGAEFGVTQESLDECRLNIQRALEEKVLALLSANN